MQVSRDGSTVEDIHGYRHDGKDGRVYFPSRTSYILTSHVVAAGNVT